MAMHNLRPASKLYTLTGSELSKQLATSAIIIRGVLVTGGGSSAVIRLINSRVGSGEEGPGPGNYIVAANAGESTPSLIQHNFDQGLYIELEQGGAQNGEATVFYD